MAVMSLGRTFAHQADLDPDAVAVHDREGSITRGELHRRSDAVARRLIELGVQVDDVVTIGIPSTIEFVVLCAAVWKAGATPQPVSPHTDPDELRAIVELADPALVVGFDDITLPGVRRFDAIAPLAGDPPPDVHAASWKAPVSGGSTGRPKIIFSGTPATVDPTAPTAPYIPASAVQLVTAPLHHSAPFLFAMRGLFVGHTLVLLPRFDPVAALRAIERHRVTWALFVPTTMRRVTALADRDRYDVSSLQSVLHLGSACPQWLKRDWIDWLGADRVVEIYAGTESTGVTVIGGDEWLAHPGSVGRPAPGTSVRVLGADGGQLGAGEVGEVHLRPRGGPGSTYRYVGADSSPVDGYESLGDLGWLDEDGYLYLADRAADVITVGEAVVYPSRVEAVLDSHPAVRSSAAFGLPGDDGDEVHAVAEASGVDVDELLTWVRERLGEVETPGTIELVDGPVRDDAGKVRRSRLRDERRRTTR